ncbi:uncharacterized protein LOC112466255 [Temnothorax curvispinosus]|uniref:Uncharacterized protein LOC112466255 n=1 Tax=Temnothorax curvispinosus TaxID=300111 RepID=A0A6J1R4U3_9HYME|nr:uncharacterized protein LOC112466255 [Temnothorax curvispinosus]
MGEAFLNCSTSSTFRINIALKLSARSRRDNKGHTAGSNYSNRLPVFHEAEKQISQFVAIKKKKKTEAIRLCQLYMSIKNILLCIKYFESVHNPYRSWAMAVKETLSFNC